MANIDPKSSIAPNGVIGILGGGQLGRMLAMAAARLGLKTHIYCPDTPCPAAEVASAFTSGSYNDEKTLAAFAAEVDVVTYEFENVPAETVEILEANNVLVRPGAMALEKAQDRLFEKQFIEKLGAAVAPHHPVDDLASLEVGLNTVGRPAILKTRRLGYDGKGQTRLTDRDIDLHGAFEKAIAFAWEEVGAAPSILEGHIPFEREVSIIGARGAQGDIRLFDPVENVHKGGILRTSTVPASLSDKTAENARKITADVLDALNYIGVIGVEFFVLPSGQLIVNEFAPRVHNSGHWTMDACAVCQFEQHIRAVAGWPLGDPSRHSNAIMTNLIGDEIYAWKQIAEEKNASLHLYGKEEARAGRKMGHVNRIS